MKTKILSLLTALAMVVGIMVLPITYTKARASETDGASQGKVTKSVTIHKMLLDKKDFYNFTEGTEGKNGVKYDGNSLGDAEALRGFFGQSAKEIEGVYFVWQLASHPYMINEKGEFVDFRGDVIKTGATDVSQLNPSEKRELKPAYIKAVTDSRYYNIRGYGGTTPLLEGGKFTFTQNHDDALGGKTGPNGLKFDTSNFKGEFIINEVIKHSYSKDENLDINMAKAVPIKITLPVQNYGGIVEDVHVYPKNTTCRPEVYKDFTKEFTQDKPNGRTDEEKEAAEPEAHNVGDVIGYTIKTIIPPNPKYKAALWDDKMTEGLTFVQKKDASEGKLKGKDISIKYGDQTMDPSWYKLTESPNGFQIDLTDLGCEKVGEVEEEKMVRIDYNAVVNEKAVADIPESNDIIFQYSLQKRYEYAKPDTAPFPKKPNEKGELNVLCCYEEYLPHYKNSYTTFLELYNAQNGKKIGTFKMFMRNPPRDKMYSYTPNEDYKLMGNESESLKTPAERKLNDWTDDKRWLFKITGLDKNIEYKFVFKNTKLWPSYAKSNYHKYYFKGPENELYPLDFSSSKPFMFTINPKEPKVVTRGGKFVKTDADNTRLKGAEFVIKKTQTSASGSKDVYLRGTPADRSEYEPAQANFLKAVKDFNAVRARGEISATNQVTIGNVAYTKEAEAKAAIHKLEKERDMVWNANLKDMTIWSEDKDASDVLKLSANEEGQFEISGLAPGQYSLVEVKAPDGYALPKNAEYDFEITNGQGITSTKMQPIDFGIDDEKADDNAKRLINKKVTIPLAGGIGSLIFKIIGLAIMAFALRAYIKTKKVEPKASQY